MKEPMNNLIRDRLAFNLLKAQKEQGLMNKKTAEYLGLSPADMSFIKRSNTYDNISERKWEVIHEWNDSGLTLEEFYKSRNKPNEPEPQTEDTPVKPEPAPIPSPEPLKLRIKKAVLRVKEIEADKAKKEALTEALNNSGATIIEPAEKPQIRVKPDVLAKRKKELAAKPQKKSDLRRKEASVEDINKVLARLGVEIDVVVTLKKV